MGYRDGTGMGHDAGEGGLLLCARGSYLGTIATGRLDPGGTLITEIFPLFHFGF
jgi:hypothetical protein